MSRTTIFALASGSGRSAVAVVRISGSGTLGALVDLLGRLPEARQATLVTIRDPATAEPLDRGLALWFPGPRSFTGEDAAELQLHGGRAVVAAVLGALAGLPGLRAAEPGEFTRRAFRNRKLDLAEVEGLADLIDAETQAQRRQALRQLDGALGRWASDLRQILLEALGLAEGAIDFAEDDDLVGTLERDLLGHVCRVRLGILAQLSAAERGEKLRQGLIVTIAGPPNVGKSTLLNVLAGREVAIVSAHAGTTRDALEVDLDLGGYAVRLIDTAGLRDSPDPVEQEGVARARARAADADIVLWLQDSESASMDAGLTAAKIWRVATKADLARADQPETDFVISAQTGAGLTALVDALAVCAEQMLVVGEGAIVTRLRHRSALQQALSHLDRIIAFGGRTDFELVAEDLRSVIAILSGLVGRIETEDILGSIFARFCIGK